MKTTLLKTPLPDVLVVEIDYFEDERGFFIESWNRRTFAEAGLDVDFTQDNHSRSRKGVLRGLHYQDTSAPLAKLVRCTFGAIFDVAVDLRIGSPTFGQWYGLELSAENKKQLYVPVGFAHGFATLTDFAEVQYKQTGYYAPQAEGCIIWNDSQVGVDWPIDEPILSTKDQAGMSLQAYLKAPAFQF